MHSNTKRSLFISLLICMGCAGCGPDWEETVSRQIKQPDSISQIDSIVVGFMKQYDIPGLSFAISRNDSLVYAKGYGYADIDTKTEVNSSSLFRIGNISKPITAAAIMKLIQDGKISLDEKVFGDSGILRNDFGKLPYNDNIKKITVHELLNHTVNWQTEDYTLYGIQSYSSSHLLSFTLDSFPLKTEPGKGSDFDFMSYLVLGKIIEKVSGQTYAGYLNSAILKPLGISDMQIAANTLADRKKNEVTQYQWNIWNHNYDEGVYSQKISTKEAAAGWIASAKDLLKWMAGIFGPDSKTIILNSSTIKMMLSPSETNPGSASGWWSNNQFKNWYAMSYYTGMACEWARADNGYSWAILANKMPRGGHFEDDMDRLAWAMINDSTIQWPKRDLFDKSHP